MTTTVPTPELAEIFKAMKEHGALRLKMGDVEIDMRPPAPPPRPEPSEEDKGRLVAQARAQAKAEMEEVLFGASSTRPTRNR